MGAELLLTLDSAKPAEHHASGLPWRRQWFCGKVARRETYMFDANDEEREEGRRQLAEEFERRSARVQAAASSRRSEVGVLKAQVAGLLDELAIAQHRIDMLEDSSYRRLDRLDERVDGLVRPTEPDRASSTDTTVS